MKVEELFERISYQGKSEYRTYKDSDTGKKKRYLFSRASWQHGPVKDWMKAGGVEKEHMEEALREVKKLPEFKALRDAGLTLDPSSTRDRNGTLSFIGIKATEHSGLVVGRYNIYANGLIRGDYSSTTSHVDDQKANVRLSSPKPRMTVGNPVKSLLSTYAQAMRELLSKWKKIKTGGADLKKMSDEDLVKFLLQKIKGGRYGFGNPKHAHDLIKILRDQGRDLPEFKAMEKSILSTKPKDRE